MGRTYNPVPIFLQGEIKMKKTVLKINEITIDHLVKNIKLSRTPNAIALIKTNCIDGDIINYSDLVAIKLITLVQLSLKEDYELELTNADIYATYDKIVSVGLDKVIYEIVENHMMFHQIVNQEIEQIERLQFQQSKKVVLEDEFGTLIMSGANLFERLSDKKYVNSIVKTFLTNAPKDLALQLKQLAPEIKQLASQIKQAQQNTETKS